MRVLFRIILCNVGFAVAFVAVVFIFAVWVEYYFPGVGRSVANVLGLSLPGLVALWVLFLGALYATSRAAVVACAVGASLLGLVQSALVGFLVVLSQGFGGRTRFTTVFELLFAAVLVSGVALIWSFVRAKRSSRAKRV